MHHYLIGWVGLLIAYEPGDSTETIRFKNFADNFLGGAIFGGLAEGFGRGYLT